MSRTLKALIFFAALVAAWALVARARIWSPVLLPSPWSVALYLLGAVRDGTLLEAGLVTLKRLAIGYAAGLSIGLPLGLLTPTGAAGASSAPLVR